MSFPRRYHALLARVETYRLARHASVSAMAPLMPTIEIIRERRLAEQINAAALRRARRVWLRYLELPAWRRFFA